MAYAVGPFPVRAQQSASIKGCDRSVGAGGGRAGTDRSVADRTRGQHAVVAERGTGVVGLDERDLVRVGPQDLQTASASPLRTAAARALMSSVDRWFSVSSTTGDAPWSRNPSTRSFSTAPAPTEVSCSGSPTSTSRVSGRTASRSRAIIVRSTMDASSTTTRSYFSRLLRSWTKRVLLSGRHPSSRWRVFESRVGCSSGCTWSAASSPATASWSRVAALPVGAASATE